MKNTIIVGLFIIATITAFGAVAHQDARRGKNSVAVSIIVILALAAIIILGGVR